MTVAANNDDTFQAQLLAVVPHTRAFARSLCNNVPEAEDLAQDAIARAWASRRSYTMGTNLKAWVFMILRNQFYSNKRRSWRWAPLDPEIAERTLTANINPTANLELDELRRALGMLPDEQREALILIAAGGLSYEEVSEICGAAIGTIKSRVSRARDRLALIYAEGVIPEDGAVPAAAMGSIFAAVQLFREARCA